MRIPSIFKKFLMALSGLVLVGFVFGHMAGNLQMFAGPDMMNEYAYQLQNLPYNLLWVARGTLLAAVVVHVWMAILLTKENRGARPQKPAVKNYVQASLSSRYMGVTGSIILLFVVFHLGHYTIRNIFPYYNDAEFYTMLGGIEVYNVYKMVVVGFSKPLVSLFYFVAMALLCMHLSHGVSSMFQSMGLRNKHWKPRLDAFAALYAWVIFLGFIAIPAAVMLSKYCGLDIIPIEAALAMGR